MKVKAWRSSLLVIALLVSVAAPVSASAGSQAEAAPTARTTTWEPRPAQWHRTVKVKDLAIPMSDGKILRGDLTLPATADGDAVKRKLPVLVAITPYNKSLPMGRNGSALMGTNVPADYFVKRGYAELWVDARGTGGSEGRWSAFSERENKDTGEVVAWAHRQSWSDGKVGMQGGSYLGIEQLFAAEQQPPGLKAIFPTVPAADPYRDVVSAGGALDAAFLPQWFLLVSATGAIPPAFSLREPRSALTMALDHAAGRWVRTDRWIASDLSARTYRLSGSSAPARKAGGLTTGTATPGRSTLQPLPVSGLCTRSTDQWLGGLPSWVLKDLPCWSDNRLNDATGLTFQSAPATETVRFQGPVNARLYVATSTGDGLLSVALEDVAPDGSVHRITGGWQLISQRALDRSRSRYLDGRLIQPWIRS